MCVCVCEREGNFSSEKMLSKLVTRVVYYMNITQDFFSANKVKDATSTDREKILRLNFH